jgi:hypothetical protein
MRRDLLGVFERAAVLKVCGNPGLREKTVWSLMQLFGAGSLMVVVLTHVAEALQLFPSMHWGLP